MRPIPKVPNDAVKSIAAKVIAKRLHEIAGFGNGDEESQTAADIINHCGIHDDGYACARDLEQYAHWRCDMQIAETLDEYQSELVTAMRVHLEEFRRCYGIEPPLPVGSRVKCSNAVLGLRTGTISEIYQHRPMTYLVKQDGDPEADPKKRRLVVYFDEVTELPTEQKVQA